MDLGTKVAEDDFAFLLRMILGKVQTTQDNSAIDLVQGEDGVYKMASEYKPKGPFTHTWTPKMNMDSTAFIKMNFTA